MRLDVGDFDVELDEITIKSVILEVKERLGDLSAEVAHIALELVHNGLNVLQVVLLERLELANRAEKVDQLANTARK